MATKIDIPNFPTPLCVAPMLDTEMCTFLGMSVPCMPQFNEDSLDLFGHQLESSHVWVSMLMILFGVFNLCCISFNNVWKHSMGIVTSLYSIGTGLFSLFRFYWGISRPLLVIAAIHNLFEWWILVHLSNGTDSRQILKARGVKTLIWTMIVISLGLLIPSLMIAFPSMQAAGIMLDNGLPAMYFTMYFFGDDPKDEGDGYPSVSQVYRLPFIAHSIHLFFTILPLALAIFFEGSPSWFTDFWLEVLIMLSAPITHLLYISWSWRFDNLAWKENSESNNSEEKQKEEEDDIPSDAHASWFLNSKYVYVLPNKYKIQNVRARLFVAFILGLVPLIGLPVTIKQCDIVEPSCVLPEQTITRRTTARVRPGFEIAFEGLVSSSSVAVASREAPGIIDYSVVQKIGETNVYVLSETWKSPSHLPTSTLFDSSEFDGILESNSKGENEYYENLAPDVCRASDFRALVFEVDNKCKKVWNVIKSSNMCFFVPGCSSARYESSDDAGNDILKLTMNDGRFLNSKAVKGKGMSLTYELLGQGGDALDGYTGSVSLKQKKGVCEVLQQFSIPRTSELTADLIYQQFSNQTLHLNEMLSRNNKGRK